MGFATPGFTTELSAFMDDPALRDPSLNLDDMVQAHFEISGYHDGKLVSVPYHYLPPYAAMRPRALDAASASWGGCRP